MRPPRSRRMWLLAPLLCLLLGSCSLWQDAPEEESKPKDAAADAALNQEMNPLLLSGGDVSGENYNVSTPEELAKIDNGAEGELYFTDPDNPEADISGISNAFERRRSGNQWISNYLGGLRLARKEGLPIIIWFHDSVISPKSKLVARELLKTEEFDQWSEGKVVRICLDSGLSMDEMNAGGAARDNQVTIQRLSQRYKVHKKPSFVIISASGRVVTRIDGYDGYINQLALSLKAGVKAAEEDFDPYRDRKRHQGYRDWHSRDETQSIFAKAMRYDSKNQVLYMRDYTGRQLKSPLDSFSPADRDYIEQRHQQAKRSSPTTYSQP